MPGITDIRKAISYANENSLPKHLLPAQSKEISLKINGMGILGPIDSSSISIGEVINEEEEQLAFG